MGAADFYVGISFNCIEQVIKFEEKFLKSNANNFIAMRKEVNDDIFLIACECYFDNLLPSCFILFDIIEYCKNGYDFIIESRFVERKYDFNKEIELVNFILEVHKDRIRFYYEMLGALVVKRNYYINCRKLKKLYFKYSKKSIDD